MKKYKKILNENIEKNLDNVNKGFKFYNDIYKIVSSLEPVSQKYKQNLNSIASKFIDTREVGNMAMFFYFESIEHDTFNEAKFKNLVTSFYDLLSSDPKENIELQEKYQRSNGEKDELGYDVYERYYFDSLKPFLDIVYKNFDKLEKRVSKAYTKNAELSEEDIFTYIVLRMHDQGIVRNLDSSYSQKYKTSTFNKDDSLKFLKNVVLNTTHQILFNNALIDHKIYLDNIPFPAKYEMTDERVDLAVRFYESDECLSIDVSNEFYSAFRQEEPSKEDFIDYRDNYARDIENFFSSTILSFNDIVDAKFKNSKYANIYIDGVKLSDIESNIFTQAAYLAHAISEGNHAIDNVVMLDDGFSVYPKIVPVKFNHNYKELNKGRLGWFNRLLNFVGFKHDIITLDALDKKYQEQQKNSKDRYNKIYATLKNDINKYNETNNNKVGFNCPNQEYSIKLDNKVNLDLNLNNNIIDKNHVDDLNLKKEEKVKEI